MSEKPVLILQDGKVQVEKSTDLVTNFSIKRVRTGRLTVKTDQEMVLCQDIRLDSGAELFLETDGFVAIFGA